MNEVVEAPVENYDWLTESLFEPIIEKEISDCFRNDYDLKLTSIKPAVGKGDNYASLVTRVELVVNFVNMPDRRPKVYNFIVKSSIPQLKEVTDMGIYDKEIQFYEQIAQKFLNFDDSITFLPKCFLTTTQDRQIIIMNDVTANGYKMLDRLTGLDFEHCKLFYKTIAQFHALGAAYYEKFGRYPDNFHQPLYRLEKDIFDEWSEILFIEFLKVFDRYDALKPYREKMIKLKDDMFEAVCEIVEIKPDQFNVLNHGDSWMNNILFHHDADNKPTDLCLVDFQLCVYGTPMTDLLYFFSTSPTLDVREHHFDELLCIYHTNLVDQLKKYNYSKPIPTMRELQMMVLKQGLLGANFLSGITAFVSLDPEDSRPLDLLMKDDEESYKLRYKLYNSPRYIKTLEVALNFFDRRGLLEI